MINICIVEDEPSQVTLLTQYIQRFSSEHHQQIATTHISDGLDLVEEYRGQFDILLMDIQMKHMDGMTAAEKIRALDENVVIIFITSTVQYAVQGYAVDALGYVLKPVPYPAFEKLLQKAAARIEAKKEQLFIKIPVDDTLIRLDCSSISFIESQRNHVIVHTGSKDYTTAGPLKKYEELLESYGFEKCHNAYLVNLSFVKAVHKEEVELTDGERLSMSRARKKVFLAALAEELL